MIVAVFGASGRTGRAFVQLAAEAGLLQRLHYRTAPAEPSPDTATVVVGALNDPTAVREVLRGADAAVVFLGPHAKNPKVFCAAATKAIIAGMRTQEVPRLICQTGAMIGAMPGNVSIGLKLMSFGVRRTGQSEIMDDRDEQERLVRNSKLNWMLVKPPRLTDEAGGEVLAGPAVKVGLGSHCSRTALARLLVGELERPTVAATPMYVRDV
ncbi:MAG: NAD(P)H-binding protein [Gemmatimonadaceae bacterium]|nr:NAD(P)H-binding protein [Gemmatimonadaceae bacterium]